MLDGKMLILTFSTFYLYHITTFKVEMNSNMLYKKGDKCLNDSCRAVGVDSKVF